MVLDQNNNLYIDNLHSQHLILDFRLLLIHKVYFYKLCDLLHTYMLWSCSTDGAEKLIRFRNGNVVDCPMLVKRKPPQPAPLPNVVVPVAAVGVGDEPSADQPAASSSSGSTAAQPRPAPAPLAFALDTASKSGRQER